MGVECMNDQTKATIMNWQKRGLPISLKPLVGDGDESGYCADDPDSLISGNPQGCWHSTCKAIRIFQDNGILIENEHHHVRRAEFIQLMRRY
jgi:DNA-directed RNA polymerase beta subunit